MAEGVEESRDEDDPAADAKKSADNPGEGADGHEGGDHGQKRGEVGHGAPSGWATRT